MDSKPNNFVKCLPKHMETLNRDIKQLEWKQLDLTHDCECDYCDRSGDIVDDDQEQWDQLAEEIEQIKHLQKALIAYGKLWGISLEDKAKA